MGKILRGVMDFIGLESGAEEEYDVQEENEQVESYGYSRQEAHRAVNYDEYSGGSAAPSRRGSKAAAQTKDNKVISMYKNNGSSNLIIFKPTSCEDSAHMIDSLKSNRPIIANFENIERDKAQRILDMLSGAMYAINGSVHNVSKSIYVFAPENLDVTGGGKEAPRNNSVSNLYMELTK